MPRRFLAVTVCLTAIVGLLVGLILAGRVVPPRLGQARATPAPGPRDAFLVSSETAPRARLEPVRPPAASTGGAASFADVAERINPAVVNIDATTRGDGRPRRPVEAPDPFGATPRDRDHEAPRRGAGTGFLIDASGYILTNHHVVDGADRIVVGLSDGRRLQAVAIGSDPDTDVALLKVEASRPLPFAPLGNSDDLRVGEWVIAIGNPLAYEHTVTAGVVSYLGRKLFDSSFDRYIQTDAAINFGNSGGPLINTRGQVIGINAAISSRAPNIGFAVPINMATAILPQLRERGRVTRGYIGVMLRDVDPDMQRWLGLASAHGALVQDVTDNSPGARAGIRPYDVIVAVDGSTVTNHDDLIREIAASRPGSTRSLQLLRDGRPVTVPVKLAERPQTERQASSRGLDAGPSARRLQGLGIAARELDRQAAAKLQLPDGVQGVLVWRVEAPGPAFDAGVERGDILLEINRQPVRSYADFSRLTGTLRSGDLVAVYLYRPEIDQRLLQTIRVE